LGLKNLENKNLIRSRGGYTFVIGWGKELPEKISQPIFGFARLIL